MYMYNHWIVLLNCFFLLLLVIPFKHCMKSTSLNCLCFYFGWILPYVIDTFKRRIALCVWSYLICMDISIISLCHQYLKQKIRYREEAVFVNCVINGAWCYCSVLVNRVISTVVIGCESSIMFWNCFGGLIGFLRCSCCFELYTRAVERQICRKLCTAIVERQQKWLLCTKEIEQKNIFY